MLNPCSLAPDEPIFTWQDETDHTHQLHFAVRQLSAACADLEIFRTPIDPIWAPKFRALRGLEDHRLAHLGSDWAKWPPALYLLMPDGSHLLVDGNHRYYRAWQLGRTILLARIAPKSIWSNPSSRP